MSRVSTSRLWSCPLAAAAMTMQVLLIQVLLSQVLLSQVSPAAAADAPGPAALSDLDIAPRTDGIAGLLDRIRTGRAALKERGIELGLTYIGETFANLRGGVRRGAVYDGRLDVQVDADLGTLAGLDGLSVHTNVYQIHGTGLSRYYVGNLAAVSGIEALPATRLHELWFEQALFDKALSVRAGKLAADAEFLVSPSATLFINATFGWPVLTAANLPSGGPAAPLATPGIRVRWNPAEKTSVMLGVFNGDPANARADGLDLDPQRRNRDGTDFSIRAAPLLIAEVSRGYVAGGPGPERTGVAKLGYFHHFGRFDDPRLDTLGGPLAAPTSTGIARRLQGEDGVYAILDQTIYREDETSDRGAAAFARIAASPNAASLVDLYADAGLVYKGLLPGRPDDVAGVSAAYTRVARGPRAYDRDLVAFGDVLLPVRCSEMLIEMTYQAVIAPGFTIQPDLQYIHTPGGHTRNPRLDGFLPIKDSTVFGVRATLQY